MLIPALFGLGWGWQTWRDGTVAWLGLSRSFGQKGKKLELSGPFRVTRNPRLLGGVLLVIGYVVHWPSWYALGWLVLFAAMMHMMVLTEEEHLHYIHGEEFERYCQRVPRYLGILRRSY